MLTEAKRKPALGELTTGWVAWPGHKRYYRLIEGELFVIPARPGSARRHDVDSPSRL